MVVPLLVELWEVHFLLIETYQKGQQRDNDIILLFNSMCIRLKTEEMLNSKPHLYISF